MATDDNIDILPIYSQARRSVNHQIEMYRQLLADVEYASTQLASLLVSSQLVPVQIVRYDDDDSEAGKFMMPVSSLESAWRHALVRWGTDRIDPDKVDMMYVVDGHEYWFDTSDIQTAFENVRYETARERESHIREEWDGNSDEA